MFVISEVMSLNPTSQAGDCNVMVWHGLYHLSSEGLASTSFFFFSPFRHSLFLGGKYAVKIRWFMVLIVPPLSMDTPDIILNLIIKFRQLILRKKGGKRERKRLQLRILLHLASC